MSHTGNLLHDAFRESFVIVASDGWIIGLRLLFSKCRNITFICGAGWEISAASYKPVLPTVVYIHGTGPLLVGIS